MRDNDDLDLLLDSALSSYADPGPEASLEARVLARVTAQAAPAPRRRWLPWAIALPVAAGLLFLVFSRVQLDHLPSRNVKGVVRPQEAPLVAAHSETPSSLHFTPGHRATRPLPAVQSNRDGHAAKFAPPPKLDVFPTPQPLTPEEQALALFAAHAPEPERKSLIEAQEQADAPLGIAAIHIQPLESPAQGAN